MITRINSSCSFCLVKGNIFKKFPQCNVIYYLAFNNILLNTQCSWLSHSLCNMISIIECSRRFLHIFPNSGEGLLRLDSSFYFSAGLSKFRKQLQKMVQFNRLHFCTSFLLVIVIFIFSDLQAMHLCKFLYCFLVNFFLLC